MPRYSDEAWEYFQDTNEKKHVANSASHRRGRNGRRGGMKTAADFMTQKQLRALDGEVKTYRLGSPMNWEEFNAMPNDLKVMYIKKLRKQFNVPDEELAVAMGVELWKFVSCLKSIKLAPNHWGTDDRSWYGTDDHGRFQTWWVISECCE